MPQGVLPAITPFVEVLLGVVTPVDLSHDARYLDTAPSVEARLAVEIRRSAARRTSELRWLISWDVAGPAKRILAIQTKENWALNWGPTTQVVSFSGTMNEYSLGHVSLLQRAHLERISTETPVTTTQHVLNQMEWVERVLAKAVTEGVLRKEDVDQAVFSAKACSW